MFAGIAQGMLAAAGQPHTAQDVDTFMCWAFGEDYRTKARSMARTMWKEHHPDLVEIRGTDEIRSGVQKMVDAYLESQESSAP